MTGLTWNQPCREWQGARNDRGYGQKWDLVAKRVIYIHRWVMAQIHGWEALEGMEVMHLCDNPPCFLYDHLRIGTRAENLADARAKGRAVVPATRRGVESNMARLSPDDVRAIREALATGEGTSSLGRRYGVSHKAIEYIRDRKNWAWLN